MKNNRFLLSAVTLIACVVLLCVNINARQNVGPANNADQIIGVWRIVTPALPTQGDHKKIKIITKSRFIWVHTVTNMLFQSCGGNYIIEGDTYTEFIEYATLQPANLTGNIGQKAVCKIRFEDNKLYVSIKIGENNPFEEVWERVE